jgi:hypothetical protein
VSAPSDRLTRFEQIAPIFRVRDVGRALAHDPALGFRTRAYEGAAEYGFAERDDVAFGTRCRRVACGAVRRS